MQTTQTTSSWELYKRLLGYLKSYWKMFIVSVVAMLIVAGTMPALGYLLKPLINEGLVDKSTKNMSWLPLAIVALFFVRGLFNFVNKYCTTYLSNRLVRRLRGEMFNKVMHLPTSYFSSNTGGRSMSRILSDANQVTDARFSVIIVIAKDGASVVGLLGLLTYLSWRLALITFIILSVVAVYIQTVSKRLRKLPTNNQIYLGQLMQVLGESINGEHVVKIYGGQDCEDRRFGRIANDVRHNLLKQVSASSAGTGITQLMAPVALAAIIYAAARQTGLSGFSAGDFMSFLSSMVMMFDPIKRMTGVMQPLQRGLAAAESVFTFLDQPEENNEGKQTLSPNPGNIEFRDVVHRYPEAEHNSLNHINLLVPQGKVTALAGASSCGKTTLANILPRFPNPNEGEVLIGGININEYALENLRSHMALVSQNVVLSNGTIAENIAYARADKFSEEEIINAAEAANAWEFIQKMPQGLHTEIGENGSELSGGQRQRFTIAHALLKNALILVLDEATSALDNESERLIQTALENLMQNRTTLMIAHRLSTIEKADNIVVMHEGNVVEQGTHQELVSTGGRYADLYNLSEKSAVPTSK